MKRRSKKHISNNLIAVVIVLVTLSTLLADYLAYQKINQKLMGRIVSSGTLTLTLRIPADTTPPKITITKVGPTSAINISLKGTYTDENEIANMTIEVNSTNIALANIDTSSKTWNANINLTEGWNRFYVLAYDLAGNFANVTSSSQGASVLSDLIKPKINLTAPQNSSSVANNSLITFKISDLFLADAFYTINNGTTASFNSIYELRVGTSNWVDGINYVIVNATDSVNNVEIKNFTFTYSNNYAVVLDASMSTVEAEMKNTNNTVNDLKNPSALEAMVNNFAADVSVAEYNKTLQVLDVVTNLSHAMEFIEKMIQDILVMNSSNEDNTTKTATINAKLEEILIIKNTTVKSVDVNLFDQNLTVAVANTTKSNVTDELIKAVTGLSVADEERFKQASKELQNKTTISNKVQTLTQTFLNGRTQNITLFEKKVSIAQTQVGEFYINEFIDKNITGNNDLNARRDIVNKISQPMAVLVEDPIVRWSFTDTTAAVVKYTIDKNVPTEKITESKTVITTVPAAGVTTTAGGGGGGVSGGGGGGGGGGGAIQQPTNQIASVEKRWETVSAGESLIIDNTNENIAVYKITINIITALSNADFKIASLKENPADAEPSLKVYQFLEFTKNNIKSTDASSIVINFKIAKKWLEQNRVAESDVVLYRFDAKWEALPTKLISSDAKYAHYESTDSGFGLFAIGINEPPVSGFAVDRDLIKIVLKQNETKTFSFKIKNTANIKIDISIDTDLSKYITFKEKRIALEPLEEKEVSFNVKVEVEDESNIYSGGISLMSAYLKKDIKLILEIQPIVSLFDIKVLIPKEYKQVQQGGIVSADIAIINIGNPAEANLSYSFRDLDNKVIIYTQETINFKEPTLINRQLKLPDKIETGKYIFYVSLTVDSNKAFATDFFEVVKVTFIKIPSQFQFGLGWLIAFVLAVLLIVTYYSLTLHKKKIKKLRHERVSSLDVALSLKKIKPKKLAKWKSRIANELEILKADYLSEYISFEEYKKRKEKLEKQLMQLKNSNNQYFDKMQNLQVKNFLWGTLLLLLFIVVFYLRPTIIGYVTELSSIHYGVEVNKTFSNSGTYVLDIGNKGILMSLKLSGEVIGQGNVKVYIVKDGINYTVLDSDILQEKGISSITGFAAKDSKEKEEKKDKNETLSNQSVEQPINETLANETINITIPINETINITPIINKSIAISLQYKEDSIYDEDNDGIENITKAIDLTVENSMFNWDVNKSKLCTRWEIYNLNEDKATTLCYGNNECCNFIDLESSRELWDAPFYSIYGQNGIGLSNIISAQVIYVDYSLNSNNLYTNIVYSEWANLSTAYNYERIIFKEICKDTCFLENFNESFYTIIIDIENATLHLNEIVYSILPKIEKYKLRVKVIGKEGEISSIISIYKDDLLIDEGKSELFELESDTYEVSIVPLNKSIEKIVLHDVQLKTDIEKNIIINEIKNDIFLEGIEIRKKYAIDSFLENPIIIAKASGNSLFKCKNWNYELEVCLDNWEKIQDLKVGELYNLSINKEYAAFVEGNINTTNNDVTENIISLINITEPLIQQRLREHADLNLKPALKYNTISFTGYEIKNEVVIINVTYGNKNMRWLTSLRNFNEIVKSK